MQGQNCAPEEGTGLGQQCRKWFKLNRKARREALWMQLFKELFKSIFPEVPYGQLLIAEAEMFEHFQLFFNTSVSYQYMCAYPARKKGKNSSRRTLW